MEGNQEISKRLRRERSMKRAKKEWLGWTRMYVWRKIKVPTTHLQGHEGSEMQNTAFQSSNPLHLCVPIKWKYSDSSLNYIKRIVGNI